MPKTTPQHILIVEDDREIRENLVEILELHHYRVTAVNNGNEGVIQALIHQPDLIICDVMMKGMDGFETVRTIRQNPQLHHLPIIFLTALTEQADQRHGMNLGADDYLHKPFDVEELLSTIEVRIKRNHQITQKKAARLLLLERKLDQQKSALDELNRINSHYLRGPIARLIGLAQLFLQNQHPDAPLDQETMLKAIEATAIEVDHIIHDINHLLTNMEVEQKHS